MTRPEDLVAAIRAEPGGRGFLTAGASREKLETLEHELRVTLPADLREIALALRWHRCCPSHRRLPGIGSRIAAPGYG